ncbi:MAG: response regulator, partial [Thermodesulfovibrio sp.]|nr:response regulator [Thermodesulfovibrio sp.]
VFTADNGEDGLKIAENVNPDLILVDFIMPKMTGSQFCILLKENEKLKDTPILLITGKGEAVGQAFIEKYGVQDYFIKPFKSEDLIEKVDMMLGQLVTEEEKEIKIPVAEEFKVEYPIEEKIQELFEPELKLIPEEEVIHEKPFEKIELPKSEEMPTEIIEEKQVETPSLEELLLSQAETAEESIEKKQEIEIKKEESETIVSEDLSLKETPLTEEKIEQEEITHIAEEIIDIDEKLYEGIQISAETSETQISIEEPKDEEIPTFKEEISRFNLEEINRLIENKLSDFYTKLTNLITLSIENTFKKLGIIKRDNIILSGRTFPFNPIELIRLLCKSKVSGFLTFFAETAMFEFLLMEGKIVYGISSKLKPDLGNKFLKDFTNEEIEKITKESINILMETKIDNFILEERERSETYLDNLPRHDFEELIYI